MRSLPRSFYTRCDAVEIARELLGKKIVTRMNGVLTSGIICETEAYAGVTDRASHAFGGRRTDRTETMYAPGGTAYVYLCYGVHSLFNVVTGAKDVPHAVLIRGIIPQEGIEIMKMRAAAGKLNGKSGIGPGKASRLLGIHYRHSGYDLVEGNRADGTVFMDIEDAGIMIPAQSIITGPRVGVDYAGEDALLPYRFRFAADVAG
jgi:DNA-3-methyladenine glycosylase